MASGSSIDFDTSIEDIDDKTDLFSESVQVCLAILRDKSIISNRVFTNPSEQARSLGNEMANALLEVIEKFELVEEDSLFTSDEITEDVVFDDSPDIELQDCSQESVTSESSPSISQPLSSDYEPDEKKPKLPTIDLEKKVIIVKTAREHPNWSLKTLQARGGACLTRKDELARWEKEIRNGGTQFDRSVAIKKWTYDRFCKARQSQMPVTTKNIQDWALQAAMQYKSQDLQFIASAAWANRFKTEFRIRQRKITRYVKLTEKRSIGQIKQAAENFQNQCLETISTFDLNYVLNTDQIGCEYRSNVHRTMEHVGQKTVEVHLGDVNKVTHTYTAQYTISASGRLIPMVFICLQEPTGTFGSRVNKIVQSLTTKYKNVYITCSKSGKLSTALFDLYTDNVLKPYVGDNKFVLILDSWGGQSNKKLFDKFKNGCDESSCTLQVIPPGCTPFCQPLDVYFHRQVKILIKKLLNATHLLQEQTQINTREDAIKIQFLVTHQLCAPVFRDMIEYAWFASRLIQTREVFLNVKDVCFPERPSKTMCTCAARQGQAKAIGFIECS